MRKNIWAALGAVAVALTVIACGNPGHPDPTPTTHRPTASPTSRPPTTPTTRPTSPTSHTPDRTTPPPLSAEQRNAVGAAQDYLSGQHFSRTGLIAQLKFDKYSTKAATYAVDSLDMDWSEQAALVATDYLQGQHFSRGELIDQLKFDGFTTKQATYGVKKAGL